MCNSERQQEKQNNLLLRPNYSSFMICVFLCMAMLKQNAEAWKTSNPPTIPTYVQRRKNIFEKYMYICMHVTNVKAISRSFRTTINSTTAISDSEISTTRKTSIERFYYLERQRLHT